MIGGSFAKDLVAGAERIAEENKAAKGWDDVDAGAMMEAVGAVGLSESDLKYNEVVEKFINRLSEETFLESSTTRSLEQYWAAR